MQMDTSYATIPVYGGEHLRLYRDVRFINTVCMDNQVINHPIYAVDEDFGCFTLSSNDIQNSQLNIEQSVNKPKCIKTDVWKLYFAGAFSKDGAGAGIVLISLDKENITQPFNLDFDVTNNVA